MIGVAIVAALAAGGCTSTTPGAASTTTPTATTRDTSVSTPNSSAADPLANVDPCTLLDPAVVSQNQLQPGQSGTGPGTRYCRWTTKIAASGAGYSIAIDIYDHAGLDQLSTAGFAVTNYPVGRHQGRMSKDTAGDTCSVSIGVNSMSRVDVVGVDDLGQQNAACTVATTVAPSVEQKLPG
jgi:hypothetical protein